MATQIFFYFHPENWGKGPNLTIIFQMGWNHQLEMNQQSLPEIASSMHFAFANRSRTPLRRTGWPGPQRVRVALTQQCKVLCQGRNTRHVARPLVSKIFGTFDVQKHWGRWIFQMRCINPQEHGMTFKATKDSPTNFLLNLFFRHSESVEIF